MIPHARYIGRNFDSDARLWICGWCKGPAEWCFVDDGVALYRCVNACDEYTQLDLLNNNAPRVTIVVMDEEVDLSHPPEIPGKYRTEGRS